MEPVPDPGRASLMQHIQGIHSGRVQAFVREMGILDGAPITVRL